MNRIFAFNEFFISKNVLKIAGIVFFCVLLFSTNMKSATFYVNSQQEFDNAQDASSMTDSIVWMAGTYSDIYMNIDKDNLTIMAENLGTTIFTGASRVNITGDDITFQGFQFLNGNIGTQDVINIRGSHINFTQINIRAYTCYKYLRVREESQYVEITYCNFENRLNLDDQNILSILVDDTNPGYHKIRYCSFKNFEGIGNDQGIEPIRIGLSTQADHISRSIVEYCYFTKCDGDGEIISSKATQNVYRYNTFENNPKAELVLRHGSQTIVYGNFFLNGKGGVRVREGQNHFIYNNYFYELDDRAIYLQNNDSDPLDNINIAFNTIVDCAEVILGGDGNDKPTNVTISNNIFTNPDDDLFEEPTGTENWMGNISFGSLGISLPTNGVTMINPQLEENSEGFFGLSSNSPAINAAQPGYKLLPEFVGINDIDTEILFDLMGQDRPSIIAEKDLGCHEHPHNVLIQPIVTEENTGPSYNTSMISNLKNLPQVVNDLIKIHPNPVSEELRIEIKNESKSNLRIDIFNAEGKVVDTISMENIFPEKITLLRNVVDYPVGLYTIRATVQEFQKGVEKIQTVKFIKSGSRK